METLQPKLRFPEFSGDWNEKNINEVLKIGSGRDYKHLDSGEIPVFGTGGLMTRVNDFLFDGETVCIGRKGTIDKPFYYNGKIWTVDTLFYTHSFNNSLPKFIYNQFQRINWREHSEASGVPSLSKSTIEKIKIKLASLEEQTKIANFLSAVDTKINQLTQKKNLLEQYKKGVMQKIFNQEIRFKDENGNDFADWEEKSLKEVINKFIVPMRDKPKDLNGEVPWCRIEDFDGKFLYKSKSNQGVSLSTVTEMNLKVYPLNTLLVSCSANLGFCAIVKNPLITNQTFIGLSPNEKLVDVEFLYYVMKLSSRRLNVLSSGTTISYLSREEFENFRIHLPSIKEQTKIANFLSAIDENINQVSKQLKQTTNYKKGLLQKMFV